MSASAKVKVEAAVVSLPGTGSNFAMIDPEDQSLQRSHSMMTFENAPGEYPVFNFGAESDLERFIQSRTEDTRITVGRIRVPRFRVNHIYWPPSKRVLRRMFHLQIFYEAGRIRMPKPEDLQGLEGHDLNALWEPIAEDYPALKLFGKEG